MNTIRIKSLSLLNFKGVRKLQINDFGKTTDIYGANASGKTTIFDAFIWLLFGKDSTDRATFEIKTLDKDNKVIPNIEHEVSAILLVNNEEIEIRRILREKWVTQRGAAETTFQGNETIYYWNDVPVLAGEYASKISKLMDDKVFKMITSPSAFNALKWQDQRQVLIDITGGVSDSDIAEGDTDFQNLLSKLSNKTLDEYKKQVSAQIKKAKDELKMIPTRIDEVERGKPVIEMSFAKVRQELEFKQKELKAVEDSIFDKMKAQKELNDKKVGIQDQIYSFEQEISKIEHEARLKAREMSRNSTSEVDSLKQKAGSKKSELTSLERQFETLGSQLEEKIRTKKSIETKVVELRSRWNDINARSFQMAQDETCCPTCKQELPSDQLQEKRTELKSNFEGVKKKDLKEITDSGVQFNDILEKTSSEIVVLEERRESLKKDIQKAQDEVVLLEDALKNQEGITQVRSEDEIIKELLEANTEIVSTNEAIKDLKEKLENMKGVDMEDLKTRREEAESAVQELKKQLGAEDQIKTADNRKAQLMEEEATLAQQIADVEKEQFVIENFIRTKIDRLEGMINQKFSMISFKLFETQINGGEVETCKALIAGVPFSDANTASRINAGIDIINTLCEHYKVSAPIFIDNRESVINLLPSDSQIINLFVSEKDTTLRVEPSEVSEMQPA